MKSIVSSLASCSEGKSGGLWKISFLAWKVRIGLARPGTERETRHANTNKENKWVTQNTAMTSSVMPISLSPWHRFYCYKISLVISLRLGVHCKEVVHFFILEVIFIDLFNWCDLQILSTCCGSRRLKSIKR